MVFKKKQTGNPIKKKKLCLTTLIPETNTNQEKPIIHFTNTIITITILKSTINHVSQRTKTEKSNPQEIQNKPLIRKSK